MPGFLAFKDSIRALLLDPNWQQRLDELVQMPLKKAVGPLFSFFCDPDELVKWRAVTAFGKVVDALAQQNMESARVMMRRLMWSLNEESGAIGWGAPEALGETMAQNASLAKEYHRILISYAQEPERGDGNFLEHVPLRRGVYWGLARLAEVQPDLVRPAMPALLAGIAEDDPALRGLSALALGHVGGKDTADALLALIEDTNSFDVYRNGMLHSVTVSTLAEEARQRLLPG